MADLDARRQRDPEGVSRGAVDAMVGKLRDMGPDTYLLTTRSQEAEVELVEGYPPGWGEQFRAWMSETPALRVVVANPDAVVYQLVSPPAAAAEDRPARVALASTWTPLTSTGIVCLVALVGVLLMRELRRLSIVRATPAALTPMTLVAIPLVIAVIVVVVERFVVLA